MSPPIDSQGPTDDATSTSWGPQSSKATYSGDASPFGLSAATSGRWGTKRRVTARPTIFRPGKSGRAPWIIAGGHCFTHIASIRAWVGDAAELLRGRPPEPAAHPSSGDLRELPGGISGSPAAPAPAHHTRSALISRERARPRAAATPGRCRPGTGRCDGRRRPPSAPLPPAGRGAGPGGGRAPAGGRAPTRGPARCGARPGRFGGATARYAPAAARASSPAASDRLGRQAPAQDRERDALAGERVRHAGGVADEEHTARARDAGGVARGSARRGCCARSPPRGRPRRGIGTARHGAGAAPPLRVKTPTPTERWSAFGKIQP